MSNVNSKWSEQQRGRWIRPNGQLYVRADAYRFAAPGTPAVSQTSPMPFHQRVSYEASHWHNWLHRRFGLLQPKLRCARPNYVLNHDDDQSQRDDGAYRLSVAVDALPESHQRVRIMLAGEGEI